MNINRHAATLFCAVVSSLGISAAQAGQLVVYDLGVDSVGGNSVSDVVTGWTTPGSFGSSASLINTVADFRSSWVDNPTNWASVTNIDVGMYDANGNEAAHLDFAGPDTLQGAGATVANFFSAADLVSGSYTDLSPFGGNFFSETGDTLRKWFVQDTYGGCPADTGWIVVDIDGGEGCAWEYSQQALNLSGNGRVFLYALGSTTQNWNYNGIVNWPNGVGSADVFAITVTSDLVTPEPSTFLTLAGALGVLGCIQFRRRRA